ncbi:protein ANTAGONIST OF LIKE HETEROCHROMATIN PROTEIN 1-like [Salarias fasciatus]|uniref:Protein ANTAGONIST OF LIKE HETEROCHROMATIN PROTEIN 1-like n=1 Tax=Salarias fasciatus TaxID=181472 RepID=A0A672IWY7_SALFA|nr:protein ANTAGONIST OF LIKE HETEROCHROMATIN PROTEIN 1-like [Salarias fasciatus]
MEDAVVGTVCLLCLLLFLLLTDLETKRVKEAVDRARRRADRRRLRRLLVVRLVAELERIEIRRRRRRRVLLRILARRCSPCVWTHKRADEWWTTVVPGFRNQQWIQNFRMSRGTFKYVCCRLKPALEKSDTNYRPSVPLDKRVAIAIWKLATNAEYRSAAQLFGVGVSTACSCLKAFCSAVEEILLPEVIRLPDTEQQRELALLFEQRFGLPHCVGALGGLQVPILAPREDRTNYLNPAGGHSVVLQAVVDGTGCFWSAYAGQPGSLSYAHILCMSDLWELAETCKLFSQEKRNLCGQEVGHYILGDEAHPLTDWLLTPFADDGSLGPRQLCYNHKTGRAKAVVGEAFCRLRGRWRCLQERNDCSPDRVTSMILTCCVLHNLCERRREPYQEEWEAAPPPSEQDNLLAPTPPPAGQTEGAVHPEGRTELAAPPAGLTEGAALREALMHYLSN